MTEGRSNYRAALESGLVCPKPLGGCNAMNRPGATVIEVQQGFMTAYCSVCSHSGPLETFRTQKEIR